MVQQLILRLVQRCVVILIMLLFWPPQARCADEKSPIKIGVVYALTGAAAQWGSFGQKGLELARDEINAKGGIHGHPVKFLFEDSRTMPAAAVTAYRKVVSEGAQAVFGDVWSFITNPIIPIAERDGMLLASPTVMDRSLPQTGTHFFTMGYQVESTADVFRAFLRKNPAAKRVLVIHIEDSWLNAHVALWKRIAEEEGRTLIILEGPPDWSTNATFGVEAIKISHENPDALIVSWAVERVLQKLSELKFKKVPVYSTSDAVEALYLRKASRTLLEGVYFSNWVGSTKFREAFKQKFGEEPLLEAQNSYELLRSLAQDYRKDGQGRVLRPTTLTYEGAGGRIDFSYAPIVNRGKGQLYRITRSGEELVPFGP